MTRLEQMRLYVENEIKHNGIKYKTYSFSEITGALLHIPGKLSRHVRPSDYCYNLWNDSPIFRKFKWTAFFERIAEDKYLVLGSNYPYTGVIIDAKTQGKEEIIKGYWVNGTRYEGHFQNYPDDLSDSSTTCTEGKKSVVALNKFERNPVARKLCLECHDTVCTICGFDSGKVYGEKCEGLIHVHHLKMISKSDGEYVINPVDDLRPVCPNCHMILHSKKNGCYTIEEVRDMLKRI